jgi:biotin carboxyl carrier protein
MRYTIERRGADPVTVDVRALGPDTFAVRLGDAPSRVIRAREVDAVLHLIDGLSTREVRLAGVDDQRFAWSKGQTDAFALLGAQAARVRARQRAAGGSGALTICSPMPGRVVKVLVGEGDAVEVGQGVVIVEAMKMENELRAEAAGTVKAIRCAEGDLVGGGDELVVLEA